MTFETTPAARSSVNDNLVYVAYDAHAASPSTYPNYKYVAEVWINGTQVFTGRYFPNPTNNRAIMDFSSVVREYVSATLNPSTGINGQTLGEGEFSVSVVIKMREEYSGTTGAVILTDSTRVFFNHYNGRTGSFTLLSSYEDAVASNRSTNLQLTFSNAYYFVPYFALTTGTFNVAVTVGSTTNTKTITPSAANTCIMVNISPTAINLEWTGFITSSTTSYTVQIDSVTYTVEVICAGLYDNYYVTFLNKWGGWETMLFNKVSRKNFEITRKQYNNLPYRVSSSGVVTKTSNNVAYAQRVNYGGVFKERLSLNTDWLSTTDWQWLGQLVLSPQVYVEDGGTFYPASITENQYQYKTNITDGLIQLSINVEFADQTNVQWQ